MNKNPKIFVADSPILGLIFGITAFLLWGLSPIYWKELSDISAIEVISHRIIWSFVFLFIIIILRGLWSEFISVMGNAGILVLLLIASLLINGNSLFYIWAVGHDLILHASLGYYITPLVNVLLGILVLGEKFRSLQKIAVLIATISVLYLTYRLGEFPWIALGLAFSFGFYGLIRKTTEVGTLVGLTVESALLTFPAGVYLILIYFSESGAFLLMDRKTDFLLLGASLITVIPLFLFTLSAKRLKLSTVGFLQYIGPTCLLITGVFIYGETFTITQMITFTLIWISLVVYTIDSIIFYNYSAGAAL